MQAHINTYTKGMNRDMSPSKYSNEQYFDMLNFRIAADNRGLSTASRVTQYGNSLLFNIPYLQEFSLDSAGATVNAYIRVTFTDGSTLDTSVGQIRTDTTENLFTDIKQLLNGTSQTANPQIITLGESGYIYIQNSNFEQRFASIAILNSTNNLPVTNITIGDKLTTYKINGYDTSRNYLCLVTTNESNDSIIWTIDHNNINLITAKYKGDLELTDTLHIFAKLSYDNENSLRLYLGDESVFLRSINLFDEDLESKNKEDFNLVRDFEGSNVKITSKQSGGSFRSGLVQYAYSLYSLYDKETYVTGMSDLVSVDDLASSLGNSVETNNLNVSFTGRIDGLDKRFTHIKIYRLHYTEANVNPSVTRIVDEQFNSEYTSNDTSGSIVFSDDGQKVISSETLEKIKNFSKDNFNANDIEDKDRRLFAFNIKKDIFDIDYDSRAYSFKQLSSSLDLYTTENTLSQYAITNGSFNSTDWDNVPEEHDCINPDFWDNAGNGIESKGAKYISDPYQYKHNSTILGGSGKNISYEFTTVHPDINNEKMSIDNNLGTFNSENAENITPAVFAGGTYQNQDKSFRNSLLVDMRGYLRGEIYRFGIKFRNSYGKFSPVKWIADIKIPEDDTPYLESNNFLTDINNMYINFLVNISQEVIDSGVTGFEIVRVKREDKDKTILANGIMGWAIKDDFGGTPSLHPTPEIDGTDFGEFRNGNLTYNLGGGNSAQKHIDCMQFYSPEVSFDDNFLPRDIKVQFDGILTGIKKLSGNQNARKLIKYHSYYHLNLTGQDGIIDIQQVERVSSVFSPANASLSSVNVTDLNFRFENFVPNKINTQSQRGGMGATLLMLKSSDDRVSLANKISSNYNYTTQGATETTFAKLVRNLTNQYGGSSYEAKSYNSYISAGELVVINNNPQQYSSIVKRGDIFIGGFELYRKMVGFTNDTGNVPNGAGTSGFNSYNNIEFCYIPMPTTHNIDKKLNKGYWTGLRGVYYLRERKEHFDLISAISDTWESVDVGDAFELNKTYNKQNDEIVTDAKPFKYVEIENFDVLVKFSDGKVPNELIDSWSEFKFNNEYNLLDNNYGKGVSLEKISNQIYFIQERAFGLLLINPRISQVGDNGLDITVGRGDVLSDHTYYDEMNGCAHRTASCAGNASILFYNSETGTLHSFTGKAANPLSVIKGMDSYFMRYNDILHNGLNTDINNPLNNQGVSITYNNFENVFYIATKAIYKQESSPAFAGSSGNTITNSYYRDCIEFYELGQIFGSRYSFIPDFTINFQNRLITANSNITNNKMNESIWEHNDKAIPGNYYGEQFSNRVAIIINPNQSLISTFDIIDYKAVVFERVLATGNQIFDDWQQTQETFNRVRFSNDYQSTGWIEPDVERLQRAWRINNFYNASDNTRFRDVYLKLEMEFENTNGNKMFLDDIITKYRASQY